MKRIPFCILLSTMTVLVLMTAACSERAQETLAESGSSPASSQERSIPEESAASESMTPESPAQATSSDDALSSGSGASAGTSSESSAGSSSESSSQPPLTFTVTIPEGYTLARIGMLMEEKGVCTAAELIEASQTGDFSEFPLIAAIKENPNRCFRLEGYLFPDTYEFYTGVTPDRILSTILSHTEKKITSEMREAIASSGLTVDEVITLASIVEKEAYGAEEMPNISSVLHNRLAEKMRLQCDVTITYVEGAIKPFITGDVNRYNSYYNTYKCDGLPAGPICNPGLPAIQSVITPAKTEYLFFVTDKDKKYYYAKTLEEHNETVRKISEATASEKSGESSAPVPASSQGLK